MVQAKIIRAIFSRLSAGILALVFFLLVNTNANAQQTQSISYRGISVSPAIKNLSLDQNLPLLDFKIEVSNNLSSSVSLNISSLDFKSLNETGGVAFISSGSHKYGLADWLKLPLEPVVLKPHSSKTVTVSVENRKDLSPGGHYAAVLFKNSSDSAPKNNSVSANQVVAVLVFLKKSGGEIYRLQLEKPDLGMTLLRIPQSINLPINNTGNTQTLPRGTISITDPRGIQVKRGIINAESGLVLPDSTRLFQTSLFPTGRAWLPGRYTAAISYRPADTNQVMTASYSFVYLSPLAILLLLVILVTFLLFLRYLVRRFKKRKSAREAASRPKAKKTIKIDIHTQ